MINFNFAIQIKHQINAKKDPLVVESIDIEDSSGSKANIAFIENFHYRKDGSKCTAVGNSENKSLT